MDVALIQWPSDEALRRELARLGHPRLLLVDPEAGAPVCSDALEDWVRLPVSSEDRDARIRALEGRTGLEPAMLPRLSVEGMLQYQGERIQLPAIQADLLRLMIERFDAVVSRETLASAWPRGSTTGNNIEVTIGRLRRRLEPVGLRIRSVRSRGYLLTRR